LALLPCLLAAALFFCAWARRMPLRLAFFAASTSWAAALWLLTELLSLFHRITAGWLFFAWSVLCLVLVAILARPGGESDVFRAVAGRVRSLSRH